MTDLSCEPELKVEENHPIEAEPDESYQNVPNEEDDEDIENLYPIQNLAVEYLEDASDDNAIPNAADLVETEMPDASDDNAIPNAADLVETEMPDASDDNAIPNAADLVETEMADESDGEENIQDGTADESEFIEEYHSNLESYNQDLQKAYIGDFIYPNEDDLNSNNDEGLEEGKGSPLVRFSTIVKAVEGAEYEIIQVLYQLLYQRSAWDTQEILTQRILEFCGFTFSPNSEEYFNREMLLQTQPNDVLVKLTALLGLDQVQKCHEDIDKARPGLIQCIMGFLSRPSKRSRAGRIIAPIAVSDGKTVYCPTKCGCRNMCLKKIPKPQRVAIIEYVKDLQEQKLLDSYLRNMIHIRKIVRKPESLEYLKKNKEVTYMYFVKYGGEEVVVCKGAFIAIYNLSTNKLTQLQKKMKYGRNLPQKIDLKDFPPMPVIQLPIYKTPRKSESSRKIASFRRYQPNEQQKPSSSDPSKGIDKSPELKTENHQLKDFPLVVKAIENASEELLIDVHFLLFLSSADEDETKERILEFSGFSFESDSEEYDERKEFLQRMSFKMIMDVAKSFSLPVLNTKENTISYILSFLLKPNESSLRSSETVSLSDVELDDFGDMSDDSDVSITCEVVEKKVECIELLSSEEDSDGEKKKLKKTDSPSVSPAQTNSVKKDTPSQSTSSISGSHQKTASKGGRTLRDFETIRIIVETHPIEYITDIFNVLYMKLHEPATIRSEILNFSGFPFNKSSQEYIFRKQLLDRMVYNSVRRIYNMLIHNSTEKKVVSKPQMILEIFDFLFNFTDQSRNSSSSSIKTETPSSNPVCPALVPPSVPSPKGLGNQPTKLSDLKRVFQRVACFPCEYLVDVHKLLFMEDCDQSVIRQNIFGFRGFQFTPDSTEFLQRKMHLEYLTFHSLRKVSSVLTTRSVDLRNSTKHELATHLAEVLAEYCQIPSAPATGIENLENSDVENIVVTPLIDPSITGDTTSEMTSASQNDPSNEQKNIIKGEKYSISTSSQDSSKRKADSPSHPSKRLYPTPNLPTIAPYPQVNLLPTGLVLNVGGIPQGLPITVQSSPSTLVGVTAQQIINAQAASLPSQEKCSLPSQPITQKDVGFHQSASKISSDDEDCDRPLSSLVGHPIDSVLEKHVEDIVKNTDLQSITINGVIKKVYEMYPKFDLSYRKEFLKSTIRTLLYRLGQEKSDTNRNTDSPDCSVTTTEIFDNDSQPLTR